MLSWLRVSGFALIDAVELPLGAGLTVITGETGAGKSILIDALGLLRGGRASAELIRTGREEAEVEAQFDLPADAPVLGRLREVGRTAEETLVVRRIVARAGRGRVFLAGGLATVGELGEHVGPLVDITSQHDQQSLMDPDSQMAILDAFADIEVLVEEARGAWAALTVAEEQLVRFEAETRIRAEKEEYLRFSLGELEEAALAPGEEEALKAERERIRGAERFVSVFGHGEEALYSGDGAASTLIAKVARDLRALADLDPGLSPLAERLGNAQALVDDVAADLGRLADSVRFDPERLAQIEERLFLLARLTRKHGGSVAAAIARREEIAHELEELGSFEEGLSSRRQAAEAARSNMNALADRLGERRRKAARSLAKKINETLAELGLKDAAVKVAVEQRTELGPRGRDRVRFLFAPNPGEEARPLAKIASGGELSRVMLAVKRALARADRASTYVFDEVDAGVGGGTAEIIGRKLKAISRERQVLAVTHLPQIAAFADHHIRVEKAVTGGRTATRMAVLDASQRSAELARMLGGLRPSAQATAHADEMLRRARQAEV